MLKGMLVLGIAATVALTGCDSDKAKKVAKDDNDFEKIVAACWKKYEHDDSGMISDPKCSNFAVVDRFMRVGKNRQCGYPDLYNGEYNLKDLSNLNKKDKAYTEKILACTDKYKVLAKMGPDSKSYYDPISIKPIYEELDKDKDCDIPSVRDRLKQIVEFGGPGRDLDKMACGG